MQKAQSFEKKWGMIFLRIEASRKWKKWLESLDRIFSSKELYQNNQNTKNSDNL